MPHLHWAPGEPKFKELWDSFESAECKNTISELAVQHWICGNVEKTPKTYNPIREKNGKTNANSRFSGRRFKT